MLDRTLLGRRAWITVAAFVLLVTLVVLPPPAADAAFPGKNGKIAFQGWSDGSIYTVNPDGTELRLVRESVGFDHLSGLDWSPDGRRIAFQNAAGTYPELRTISAVGTNETRICQTSVDIFGISWSPDASRIAYGAASAHFNAIDICTIGGGSGYIEWDAISPSWSPAGDKIAFQWEGLHTVNADGTGRTPVLDDSNGQGTGPPLRASHSVDWSPNGQRLVYVRHEFGPPATYDIFTVRPDGSGEVNLTLDRELDAWPSWSPDGTKIAFTHRLGIPPNAGPATLHVMNADGSGRTDLGIQAGELSWQPLPVTYPRPKGAAPLRASLVPAYRSCDPEQATLTHGPGLAHPSCASPALTSGYLTQGSPDANGAPAKGNGYVRISETGEHPISRANGDQADVYLQLQMSDVRKASDLSDYTGELQVRPTLRITDKLNTPTPGVGYAATVSDLALSYDVPCTPTASSTTGAHCGIATTAEALVPNMVPEGKRAIWELGKIRVFDGGPDGDAQTSPNTLFATQGVFVP